MAEKETITDWVELRRWDVMNELVKKDRPPVLIPGKIPGPTLGNQGTDVFYCYVPPEGSTLHDYLEGPSGGVKKFITPISGKTEGIVVGESKPIKLMPLEA